MVTFYNITTFVLRIVSISLDKAMAFYVVIYVVGRYHLMSCPLKNTLIHETSNNLIEQCPVAQPHVVKLQTKRQAKLQTKFM